MLISKSGEEWIFSNFSMHEINFTGEQKKGENVIFHLFYWQTTTTTTKIIDIRLTIMSSLNVHYKNDKYCLTY